jgi:CDP-glucose 4,6-dehydratase
LGLKRDISHKKMDIRNLKNIKKLIKSSRPDFIFHLAAQSLVKKSYNYPFGKHQHPLLYLPRT